MGLASSKDSLENPLSSSSSGGGGGAGGIPKKNTLVYGRQFDPKQARILQQQTIMDLMINQQQHSDRNYDDSIVYNDDNNNNNNHNSNNHNNNNNHQHNSNDDGSNSDNNNNKINKNKDNNHQAKEKEKEKKNNNNINNNNNNNKELTIEQEEQKTTLDTISELDTVIWGYVELTRKTINEDQAAFMTWIHPQDGFVHAWAVFDGHGGFETSLYCAQYFLNHCRKYHQSKTKVKDWNSLMRKIFVKFDEHLGTLLIRGGSTAQLVLYLQNSQTLISANAGDARAIYSINNGMAKQLSYDHSPMNDWDRIAEVAKQQVPMLHGKFRLGKKNETLEDIQKLPPFLQRLPPLVMAEQEKSRLLATIGVARGFGDFPLTVFGMKSVRIKPFLSCEPYVNVMNLKEQNIGITDVLVLACDGLYDVVSNQEIIQHIRNSLWPNWKNNHITSEKEEKDEKEKEKKEEAIKKKYGITAQALDKVCTELGNLAYSRGTVDDVTIFIIPLWFAMHSTIFKTPIYGLRSHRNNSVLEKEHTRTSTTEASASDNTHIVYEDKASNVEENQTK